MNKTKTMCSLALGVALYVVVSAIMKIPIVGHIQTDLGYIVFGAYLVVFGWQATIIGVVGCLIESLLFSGWIPVGWMIGQTFIGIICGFWYKYSNDKFPKHKMMTRVIITIVAVFLGIAFIKTLIECYLYSIPFEVKFVKNYIAFIADSIPMIFGMCMGEKLKNIFLRWIS